MSEEQESKPERPRIVIDVTSIVHQAEERLKYEIERIAQQAVREASKALILEFAKGKLREVVRTQLDSLLEELRFSAPQDAPPVVGNVLPVKESKEDHKGEKYELTLKEYLRMWMRGKTGSWGQRPRIWEIVENQLNRVTDSYIKEELSNHIDQVKKEFREEVLSKVLGLVGIKD